mgnify:CR=1 FL=1
MEVLGRITEAVVGQITESLSDVRKTLMGQFSGAVIGCGGGESDEAHLMDLLQYDCGVVGQGWGFGVQLWGSDPPRAQ